MVSSHYHETMQLLHGVMLVGISKSTFLASFSALEVRNLVGCVETFHHYVVHAVIGLSGLAMRRCPQCYRPVSTLIKEGQGIRLGSGLG